MLFVLKPRQPLHRLEAFVELCFQYFRMRNIPALCDEVEEEVHCPIRSFGCGILQPAKKLLAPGQRRVAGSLLTKGFTPFELSLDFHDLCSRLDQCIKGILREQIILVVESGKGAEGENGPAFHSVTTHELRHREALGVAVHLCVEEHGDLFGKAFHTEEFIDPLLLCIRAEDLPAGFRMNRVDHMIGDLFAIGPVRDAPTQAFLVLQLPIRVCDGQLQCLGHA